MLPTADTHALAGILNRAFFRDPLFVHFFPHEDTRENIALLTHRFLVRHALAKGGVAQVTPDGAHGTSIWLPHHQLHRSVPDMLRFGAVPMLLKQGPAAILRQIHAGDRMQEVHDRLLPHPHWYLLQLGIVPEQQGKGLATGLMQPMLEKLDRERLPAYLDTHNPDNISLYRRFGFEMAHEGMIAKTAVRHWAMIRKPQPC